MAAALNNFTALWKPGLFKTLTGFTQDEFDRIFKKINERYETYEKGRLNRKDRKRAIGV